MNKKRHGLDTVSVNTFRDAVSKRTLNLFSITAHGYEREEFWGGESWGKAVSDWFQ